MGLITVLLYSTGYLHGHFEVPNWVALSCYVAMGLGTLTGGWRIIETMGTRITKLSQHQGFSASAGGSVMLFAASWLGIPVSTTHTMTGCVIGAGAARRASAVRWGIARQRRDRVGDHHSGLGDGRGAVLLADQRRVRAPGHCRRHPGLDRVRCARVAAPAMTGLGPRSCRNRAASPDVIRFHEGASSNRGSLVHRRASRRLSRHRRSPTIWVRADWFGRGDERVQPGHARRRPSGGGLAAHLHSARAASATRCSKRSPPSTSTPTTPTIISTPR